jgi:hypothetical protein
VDLGTLSPRKKRLLTKIECLEYMSMMGSLIWIQGIRLDIVFAVWIWHIIVLAIWQQLVTFRWCLVVHLIQVSPHILMHLMVLQPRIKELLDL